MNAKISESLGLMTISEAKQGEIIKSQDVDHIEDNSADEDKQYARENMKEIIEHGTSAMQDILDIARATEDPRAFEVLTTMMKTLIDANKSLVSINQNSSKKNRNKTEENTSVSEGGKTINNNLIVGSTMELMDLINKQKGND